MEAVAPEPTYEEWFPRTKSEQHRVSAQLDLILTSQHFRHSKRSAVLLRFIVDKTLKGYAGVLKERTLGIEVFGRAPDYDTNSDPIVRMAAGEIRKRLAQYYQDSHQRDELHIDLLPGSYVAQFRVSRASDASQELVPENASVPRDVKFGPDPDPAQVAADSQREVRPIGRLRALATIALAIVILACLCWAYVQHRSSLLDVAWGSVVSKDTAVLISAGEPSLYLAVAQSDSPKSLTGQEHVRGDSLSYSEVQALLHLVTFLERHRGSYLQSAATTTFSDLRRGPTVLLGGLDNPWTMRAQQNLRYQMATDGKGVDWIVDRRSPENKKWLIDVSQPYSVLTVDYAIVARFIDPNTQQPTLIVAGLGENGTRAAGEFITDQETFHQLLGDWLAKANGKNFEVVLETQLINGAYGPPKLLAKEEW